MTEGASMNHALDRPIRKFNPGTLQSDDEVIRQFVVRQRELDLVLEVIRGNTDSPSCQHVLIVGPRGRGKTMLLARVGAELRTDNALSERLFPVRFMEESQEIATLADFWLEALFHLAHANATGNPDFSRDLLATHADLTARWRDTNIEECARAAFLEAADRLDRRVVLMVENLQSLCSDVGDDFGWRLRQPLQSEPRVMLLATATSRFKGLNDANQPFFELFRIVELEPLDTDACRRLWNMVSDDQQTNREIKPLRILTGGSPRLLVIVAAFARHRSLRQLLEELVTLVDDHTEYFRSHLEVLAKTERRVYLAVIDLWQSSSAHEIAARARMDIRTASALIARLVDRGAVTAEGTGRKRKYAAAERLYSIYYKLRRERDEAGLVRNLIQFMTVFYRRDELAEMVGTWRVEAAQSPPIREGLQRALAASDTLGLQLEVAKELFNKGVMHHARGEHEAELAAFDDLVARFDSSDTPELQVHVSLALLIKGITHDQRGEFETALATYGDVIARFGASDALDLRVPVAQALLNKGLTHGERGEPEAALAAYDDLVARYGTSDTPVLQVAVSQALFNKGVTHGERNEPEAALAVYDDLVARFGTGDTLELQVQVSRALFNKGVRHHEGGESEAALAAYDDLVARFGASDTLKLQVLVAMALLNRSVTHEQRGESDAALTACDDLIARFGASDTMELQVQVSMALFNKGFMLHERGESEAALAAYDALIACFGASDTPKLQVRVAKALLNKGITHGQRGESEAELAAYGDLVARFGASDTLALQVPVAQALLNKGITHGQRGESETALTAYDDLVARFSTSDTLALQVLVAKALLNKGVTHGQRGESEAELVAHQDLITRFGASDTLELQVPVAQALLNRGITHGQRGESETALTAYDDLVARFSTSDTLALQVLVAKALLNKGVTHGQRGESEAELVAYQDLITRFGASDTLELQVPVAQALLNRGITHTQRGESEAAMAVYHDLVARFGASNAPELRVRVSRALLNKGDRQIEIGLAEEALQTCDEFDRRFGEVIDNESSALAPLRWQAKWIRTHALLVLNAPPAALSVFQSVCAMFVVGNEAMLREMLARVPILIAAGAPERDLVEILSADSKTADALAPLVVALRRLAGEPVRAPAEVLEVAADICKDIEEAKRLRARRGTGKDPGS